ncbi:MAG: FoF1 ATP synthase subunit gamma [Candidatus Margulisiibacteriota bacterium]
MSMVIELRGKLGGIKKINKVTEAIQVVAVAQLKKVQARQKAAAQYRKAYDRLAAKLQIKITSPAEKVATAELVYVFLSEKGFCGGFNEGLLSKAMELSRQNPETCFVVVGARGCERAKEMRLPRIEKYLTHKNVECRQLAQEAAELFIQGKVGRVALLYNEFKSMLTQTPAWQGILPFEGKETVEASDAGIFEPSIQAVRQFVASNYLAVVFCDAICETQMGETAARLITMRGATENSKKMIDELQIKLNKARQAAITVELTEIVSSFDVLTEGE